MVCAVHQITCNSLPGGWNWISYYYQTSIIFTINQPDTNLLQIIRDRVWVCLTLGPVTLIRLVGDISGSPPSSEARFLSQVYLKIIKVRQTQGAIRNKLILQPFISDSRTGYERCLNVQSPMDVQVPEEPHHISIYLVFISLDMKY